MPMPNIKPHRATSHTASRNEQGANLITAAGFSRWKPPHDPTRKKSPAGVCHPATPAGHFCYDKKEQTPPPTRGAPTRGPSNF
jgi:hypothetical protein